MSSPDLPQTEPGSRDVAIVGMSCLFAGARDLDAYWHNIISKVDSVSNPPAGEWDPEIFYDPESKSNDRLYCKRGGYIGDIADFRPTDFGIMPLAVDGGEPDQWLALRVAHEALADAGYEQRPKEHVRTEVVLGKGTYVNRGNLTAGYHSIVVENLVQVIRTLHPEYTDAEAAEIKKELKACLPPFSADTAPALIGNIIAGRIANRLDFMGPNFTVDAACASALLAVEIGVRDLLSGKYDLVLAGGANVSVPMPTMSLFCQLGALSRKERIRPFDKAADGTILGEGLGMVVLKRRKDAERDGDRIYALIKGVGVASDGRAVHVMAPRVEGEELALRRAYEMAEISPDTVGLIEAHGTATPIGDVIEVQALSRVFGGRKGALPTCALGSVKSMIGHTMPAAGIAGLIKTALALYHRVLPPTLNCEEPNPALNLQQTPFYVNTEMRPWIHSGPTPRRAGVNSFGFGGINAHAVLEEYPVEKVAARSHQIHWETEVCIIEAESRQQLIDQCDRLHAFVAGVTSASLKDLAYTLNGGLQELPFRLAVVAASLEDLGTKLKTAAGRLSDPRCTQIKDNGGVYFFEQPLNGKLAFLFPGEGAQYQNMLLDLCIHFPEVRHCFDLTDLAQMHGKRDILPSERIFPRSILSPDERKHVEDALWQINGAVEGVLTGNWAMWTLLSHLEIRPDVIAGHSTGDYSAMLASRIIDLPNEAYLETILELNRAHERLSAQMLVPEATLIAVAADSATVMAVATAAGGELHLAMDNCPHQAVLVSSKEAAERVIEQLRSRGLIYEILPFDRPYHTPMFSAYAYGAGEEFFAGLPIAAPRIETYSCTTADRYPTEVEAIRNLYVDHWIRPVLFTETVRKMYDDGVRLFVEAGPRGNLTAFVSDILRGQPHLAMPSNLSRRTGVTQINHLVGILAAQGVAMNTDYLYARRSPKKIEWREAPSKATSAAPPAMRLNIGLPLLKVAPRPERARMAAPAANNGEASVRIASNGSSQTAPARPMALPATNGNMGADAPHRRAAAAAASARTESAFGQPMSEIRAATSSAAGVMQQYLASMQTFLDVETQVMEAFLRRAGGTPSVPQNHALPMLGTIASLVPNQELTAQRTLSIGEDLFLLDHALGRPVSLTDPHLRSMMVVPLTMGMEILAEAAVALLPGHLLVGMKDVKAHHWIQVDDTPVPLHISARRVSPSASEVAVQVRNAGDSKLLLEGVMVLGTSYSPGPRPSLAPLDEERPSALASADLYDGRLMFHGPCFQGVAAVDRSGRNGVDGRLRTLPANGLFRSNRSPKFVIDPVQLDAAGQLVGFWAAEHLERGFVVFPYHLERLHVFGPPSVAGDMLQCRVRLQLQGTETITSDIDLIASDGTVHMRLEGWADRRFDPPKQLHAGWTRPLEATISEPWTTPISAIEPSGVFECVRLDTTVASGTGLWKELWPSLVLTQNERRVFRERHVSEARQLEWLSGRTVAKDAVRLFVRSHYGLTLLPADIEIAQDEHGKPTATGLWTEQIPHVPDLSISHSGKLAAAVVCDGSKQRIGIDVQMIRELTADFEDIVLTSDEKQLLASVPQGMRQQWLLRMWCTKEAVSKALGRGLIEGPSSVGIIGLDVRTGIVYSRPEGKLAAVTSGAALREMPCYTAVEGACVVAIAVTERGTL
ncbi:MAG TPA: beta-ketoacyl synthase N-terminal-like domain-containing protein [Bryobacteraceae bacterium]|nr:beta-ketoacyl synthase N-terminal-like domain-containing protein [Bryobacteraceae bacterium]